METSYSKRSLRDKLGLKPNTRIVLLNHPEDYGSLLAPIPEGVSVFDMLQKEADFIQYFATNQRELEKLFPKLRSSLVQTGTLWISWPKKTLKLSPIKSDLNENIIREIGLKNGLVDVKVIAVDETWSGLKFVYRKIDRA